MKLIPLTQGQFAMVDDEDFERVNCFKWCVKTRRNVITKHAVRTIGFRVNGKRHSKTIWMHQFISGCGNNEIDHIDGNGLNNQKSNFRPATFRENCNNKSTQSRNTSGFKGVTKSRTGWRAQISVNGKTTYLGWSKNPEGAAMIYDRAALNSFGEFARTNQKLGLLCP